MSRSETFPMHYRVGSWRNQDIYWSPAWKGFSVEMQWHDLKALQPEAVDEVKWFDREEDYDKLLEARIQNIRINDALPVALCDAMRAYANDLDYGDGCEADKVATLRNGSGV